MEFSKNAALRLASQKIDDAISRFSSYKPSEEMFIKDFLSSNGDALICFIDKNYGIDISKSQDLNTIRVRDLIKMLASHFFDAELQKDLEKEHALWNLYLTEKQYL